MSMLKFVLITLCCSLGFSTFSQGIFDPAVHTAMPFGSVNSPEMESSQQVIDQNSQTKFLDFNANDGIAFEVDMLGEMSVVTSMEFVTANDAAERDPMDFVIIGSKDQTTFDTITSGMIACVNDRFLSRTISFSNTEEYNFYRLIFTGTCSPSNINQIADVQLNIQVGEVPTITCPADATISTSFGLCGGVYEYEVISDDAEDGPLSSLFETGLGSGAIFPEGNTNVIWSTQDSDNNVNSCDFTVSVEDSEVPGCIDDIVVSIPEGQTSAEVFFDLTGVDNCTVIDTVENYIPLFSLGGESYHLSNLFLLPEDSFFEAINNGGWLGTINDEFYNDLLSTTIRRDIGNFEVLIGYHDIISEGEFMWQNEEPYEYENWQDGEPNDANDDEDYTIMKPNGEWNDVSGSVDQFPYVFMIGYAPELVTGIASGGDFPLGTTTNTFRIVDKAGNESECTFDVTVQTVSSINDQELASEITVSPNPVSSNIQLDFDLNLNVTSYTILDMLGNVVLSDNNKLLSEDKQLDVSILVSGSYYLKLETDRGTAIKSFVKI